MVEAHAVARAPPSSWPRVPERTLRRWLSRLQSSARHVIQLLTTSGERGPESVAISCGLDSTRAELVEQYSIWINGPALADLSALSHRLWRGVRLM